MRTRTPESVPAVFRTSAPPAPAPATLRGSTPSPFPLTFFLATLLLLLAALAFAASPARASLTGVWTHEGGGSEKAYGHSVHTAGDVNGDGYSDVIIGAPGVSTALSWVYVHHGSPTGVDPTPAWSRSSGTNDGFGTDVATAGDVNGDGYDDVLICTPGWSNGQAGEGRVDLLFGSPTGVDETTFWRFETDEISALLKCAAYAGDVNADGYDDFVVGATGVSGNGGKVWLFLGNATHVPTLLWSQTGIAGTGLGSDVATAGDVNADGFDDFLIGARTSARVYVMLGGAGLPTLAGSLTSPTFVGLSAFGAAVSTVGDINGDGFSDFAVGAPTDSTDDYREGRVYVYLGNLGGTFNAPVWEYESNVKNAELGASVSFGGDINGDGYGDFLCAAPNLTAGQTAEGRLYAFYGDGFTLDANPIWTADGEAAPALLGRGLCTAGDVNGDGYADVIAGAPAWEDGGTFFDEGRVAIWHGGPDAPGYFATQTQGDQENALYGSALALGDFDADGFAEQVVGAADFDVSGLADAGRVWIYPGRPGLPATTPSLMFDGAAAGDRFGSDVANVHDVNGDGFDDLLVGVEGAMDLGGNVSGAAHLFLGSATGLGLTPAWTTSGESDAALYGHSVAWAGDVNNDGYADALVGSPGFEARGRAYCFLGGPGGLAATPCWTFTGDLEDAQVGFDVAGLGDINHDGFGDVIVGGPFYTPDAATQGGAWVFLGNDSGLDAIPVWKLFGPAESAFGYAVCGGDYDGDGIADAAIGTPGFDGAGFTNGGKTEVFLSDGTNLNAAAWITRTGQQVDGRMGTVVAAADFDLDGRDELVTSQPYVWNGQTEEGQVLVYQTDPFAFYWGADGNSPLAWHGLAVATRDDVNGDGFPDILSGAPGFEDPLVHEGRAFVWIGNGTGVILHELAPGLDRAGQLVLSDQSRAIGLLGFGDGTSEVAVESLGRSPLGRDDVALEVEIKRWGVPFDGTGTFVSAFANTGAPGPNGSAVSLFQIAGGLSLDEGYRWRARHVSDHPYFTAPWFGDTGNAIGEHDFRTGLSTIVAVPEFGPRPAGTLALASHPIPFRTATTIEFEIARRGNVDLSVVDVSGRRVARLLSGLQPAGTHTVSWDGTDTLGRRVAAGVYFAVAEADGRREATRLVVLR
ncbi:MAG: FG-GAP-like repeat-containing protein [bacterium]